ncbi:MAG TPA: hypothetical protein VFS71_06605 [Flavobacterium sp.]|nr:hypothetical protein [Flavobacterium sp.]HEU4789336.1 hypothetical protein [Flavobacterium sp.]
MEGINHIERMTRQVSDGYFFFAAIVLQYVLGEIILQPLSLRNGIALFHG